MSDIAVQTFGLGKRYRLGRRQESYKTLRESLASAVVRPIQALAGLRRSGERPTSAGEMLWAIQDVSFEIQQGEVIGIIGTNGAGKSTLLKILSRITEPTEGEAKVAGRLASLLEVGTGFHPELTGRENILLNGSILGMSRSEIRTRFDEIVTFAEVERFLDTPVKRYSSGMYVRLAFSVAVHLQPDILLVDEVLAVGDVEFQKKCIGKMGKVAQEGRTVVVVSHSMSTVKALCSRALLLERGKLKAVGPVDEVVNLYLNTYRAGAAEKAIEDSDHLTPVRKVRVCRIRLLENVGGSFAVYWRQPIRISLEFEVFERIDAAAFGAGIRTLDGGKVFTVHHDDSGAEPLWTLDAGRYELDFTLTNDLQPGIYRLHVGADQEHLRLKSIFAVEAVVIEVLDHATDGAIPLASNEGVVSGSSHWKQPQRV